MDKPTNVEILHPAILFKINQLYRSDMGSEALYEATQGFWRIGPRREKAELGIAVYQGVVRDVFRIIAWHPAGTLKYRTRDSSEFKGSGRWEFEGKRAEERIRQQYLDKSVRDYMGQARAPFRYVKC